MQLTPGGRGAAQCTFIVHGCYMFRLHILAILREVHVGSTCTPYVATCHGYAKESKPAGCKILLFIGSYICNMFWPDLLTIFRGSYAAKLQL